MQAQSLRTLRDDDAEADASLYARAYGEARLLDAEDVRSWLRNEELERGWLRVLEVDGCVVGYGDLEIHDDEVGVDLAAPGHWDPFLEWVEEAARAARVPRVRVYFTPNDELTSVLRRRGYRFCRSSLTLEAVLDEPEPAALPEGFELRTYRADLDENELLSALNEVVRDDPFFHRVSPSRFREDYLRARGHDPSLWLLVWRGDELAGFALALAERAGITDLGWIDSLGVRSAWRRRGLGEALLRAALGALHARGLRRVRDAARRPRRQLGARPALLLTGRRRELYAGRPEPRRELLHLGLDALVNAQGPW